MSEKRIAIYDTTLRDGAQAQGISFSPSGKVRLAERLDAFGVDYIEGGYAGSNEKDMAFFREIKKRNLKHAKVVAFGSTRRANTPIAEDPMVEFLLSADTPAVAIVGKSWDLHVRDVLRTTPEENLLMISETVSHMKEKGREVIYDAEHFFDGYKHNPEYAMQTVKAAADGGADYLVLCDTNGGSLPDDIYTATAAVIASTGTKVAIHPHNDMGLAVANSLAAVRAGAVQIQGTMNGYGERTGNANLITVIPILETKMGYSAIHPGQLAKLSEMSQFVDELTNQRPDVRAPFVGQASFSHKAGQHANAVGKNPATFEHISPETVGNERRILVSELSGGSNVLLKAVEMGVGRSASSEAKGEILAALKDMESKGYEFEAADASFHILIQKVLKAHKPFFELDGYRVIVEKRGKDEPCVTEATIKVRVNGKVGHTVAEGRGPVDALNEALRRSLREFYPEIKDVALTDYRVRILNPEEATGAKTQVLIESGDGEATWGTVGVSENIIEASWEALVDGLEYKLFRDEENASGASE